MRTILITGATAGFGKHIVEAFLKNGDKVIATGRNLPNRQEIYRQERQTYAGKIFEYALDVIKKDEIAACLQAVEKDHGKIDILINNAGYGLFGALEDLTEEEIRYQMEVNFFGTINVTKAFLPMLRKSGGKIFNFSSVFGFMGFPLTSLYCASKFAVEGLTESLRGELAPHGVQVCLIEPGGYKTNFGTSISWGKSTPNSPYAKQSNNYQALRVKISEKNKQMPTEVAEGLLKLSLKDKLPMRKVFGRDGRMSYLTRRFLPTSVYYSVMDTIFNKLFMKASP